MTTQHTPGPWRIGPHQQILSQGWSIRIGDDSAIAYVLGKENPELRANARLIAGSPDLLEALQTLANMAESFADELHAGHPDVVAARAAIAKATGDKHGN